MPRFNAISYPLYGGVDTKVSGEVLPAPRLRKAENVWSDRTGSLRRRFGRLGLSNLDNNGNTISGWVALSSYQGRIIGFTSTTIYDYSSASGRWQQRNRATSWRLRSRPVDSGASKTLVSGVKDSATIGNYSCYAYDTYSASGANTVTKTAFTLIDSAGARHAVDQQLSTVTAAVARSSGVRVVAHGTRFHIVWWDPSTAGTLKDFIIDTTSGATIATSLAGAAASVDTVLEPEAANYGILDACDNSTYGPFVAYRTTTANTVKFGFLSTAGVLGSSSTLTFAADPVTLSVDVASGNAMHGIVGTLGTVANDVYARLRSWSGAAWTATADSGAMDTALALPVGRQSCKFESATTLRVFYDGDTNVTRPCVRQGTYTTGGTITSRTHLLPRSYLASKPFRVPDGDILIWVTNEPALGIVQPTNFLMRHDGLLCGVANRGTAVFPFFQPYGLPHVMAGDSDGVVFQWFTEYYDRIGFSTGAFAGVGTTGARRVVELAVAHDNSHVCVEDGSCLYIPSAILQQYDGISATEVGFLQFVDTQNRVTPVASNSTGSLTNGSTYNYRIVPEWINAQGEREQGTDAGASANVTLSNPGDDTVTFTIDCIPWTRKTSPRPEIVFAVYRTTESPPNENSPHHRVGTATNSTSADTVTFIDEMSDATAATQETLTQDTELPNVAPDPGSILAAGNGRVWVGGLPDDPSLVIYSKQRGHGQALTFAASALQVQFPLSAGDLTSLAVMDEQLFGFTESSIYRTFGQGFANTGAGAGMADPVVATAEAGALGHRGVSVTPVGLIYQSERGVMQFSNQLAGSYIGAPLEGLTDPGLCMGVVDQPSLQLVHLVYELTTYVYDYYHRQWYVWTHHSDGPPALYGGMVAALTNDEVQVGDTASWDDNGTDYTARIQLGWQKMPSTMIGDLSFRRVAIVGQSLDVHYLSMTVAHDYDDTTNQTIDSSIVAAGVLKQVTRIGRQKGNALLVTITDAFVDVYGADVVQATAGWRLHELTLEAGPRGGGISNRRVR